MAGLDRRDGGPTYSVPRLCQALRASGVDVDLLSVNRGTADRADLAADAEFLPWSHSSVPVLKALRMSAPLARELHARAGAADVIHDHGLWLMPNVYAGRAAARAKRPLIVTPRGMLAPEALRFSRTKKMLFWHALQKRAFRHASCFHATSDAEYGEIRDFGINAPVAVIPNGIDVTAAPGSSVPREKMLLYIGRLHPKKNLPSLIRAWALVEPRAQGWRLLVVGPDENGHHRELQTLVTALRLSHVTVEPAVYGEEKARLYRQAGAVILPSSNENFGMTVAEALAAEAPVIASRGTPWSGLVDEGCGWWVDNDTDSLARAIDEVIGLPLDQLSAMGEKGQRWIERDFSWTSIADQMAAVYAWVAGLGDRPSVVRLR